jgi:heme exporter protein D
MGKAEKRAKARLTLSTGFILRSWEGEECHAPAVSLVGLTSEQWAAWVQAVGSIAALAVAILVAHWHAKGSRRLLEDQMQQRAADERQRQAEGETHSRDVALSSIRRLGTTCAYLALLLKSHTAVEVAIPPVVDLLRHATEPIDQIPLFDMQCVFQPIVDGVSG